MRVLFSSMSRPKRVSKFHVDATGLPIPHAQNEVAYVLGYKDWHELQQVTNAGGAQRSLDDEALSDTDLAERRAYQVSRLVAYRRAAGGDPLTPSDAESIIEQVRPSALTRPPRPGRSNTEVAPTHIPEALRILLREAESRGAHVIHIRDIYDKTGVRYRNHFDLSREEHIKIEDAREILDWTFAIDEDNNPYGAIAKVRTLSHIGNARLELEIGSLHVVGGRDAAIKIRQVDRVVPLEMLGFAPDQFKSLLSSLDGPGICIVSGISNHGTYTTARALAAARPDISYLGDLRDWTALPAYGLATLRAKSAIFALERLALPHTGRQRATLADTISIVSHQYLLPVLCPHCSIPVDRALPAEKRERIENLFGITLLNARVANPEGCRVCLMGDTISRRFSVVAETMEVDGAVREEFARDGDVESAFRSLRTAAFDSPDTRGKLAVEVAMYGVWQGRFDINDVERHIEHLDDYEPFEQNATS